MELINKLKNSVKSSMKSVLYNIKEFSGIYISIIIVQLLIGVWALSAFTNYYANDRLFDTNYAYDMTVTGTNQAVTNLGNRLRHDIIAADASFAEFAELSGGRLGVTLKDGTLESFLREYIEGSALDYNLTPKYIYHSEIQNEIVLSVVLIGVVAFLVGVLILSVMYSVRTNHYKYQYGLYMTFGADKKMLGSIAMNELMAINTLTILPSAVLAYLLLLIVYKGSGVSIVVSLPVILVYIALSYLSVFLAACTSVGGLFLKPPIALITTADNSNFVSSPRRSFNIFSKNMPLHYELFTTWRFRKYIARLVLGAVAFSVIFVTGIYCANMFKAENDAANEEFIVSFKPSTMVEDLRKQANWEADELLQKLTAIDGVDKVLFEQSKSFENRVDHLLLQPGTEVGGAGYTIPSINEVDGYTRAMNNCRYVCVDEMSLLLYESLYEVEYLEGYDAEKLLADNDMVVVSEGLYGAKCFDFRPGDKITVADMLRIDKELPFQSDKKDLLKLQISNCTFAYTEFTVGAVIHDTDATETIMVGLTPASYRDITGEKRAISSLSVYLNAGLELPEISAIRDGVKRIMADYEYWTYETTNEAVFAIVDARINLPGLLYLMSILTLCISPVVWIFSQVMFYKKREPEFKLLHAMGAVMKEIRGIHLVSGAMVFLIGFVANFLLSRLFCYGIFRIFTNVLPQLGIKGMNVSFNSFVPVSVILLYAGVSALCGAISSLVPYILYKRKVRAEEKAWEEQRIEI